MNLSNFILGLIVVISAAHVNSSLASLASAGERVVKELLSRIGDGGTIEPRVQRPISNIVQDENFLTELYKAIVKNEKFAKYVSVDEEDGSYLIDWNNLAADPDSFGEFVKIIKEMSIYAKVAESIQQSMSTLSNSQLLSNLNRLNDIINRVQNTLRQAISPTLEKIKVKI